jgi:site-specific recombinase XerD
MIRTTQLAARAAEQANHSSQAPPRLGSQPAGPITCRAIPIAAAIQTFVRLELKAQKRSPETVRWYECRLSRLAAWLGADRPLVDVMEIEMEEYMATLAERITRYGGDSPRPEVIGPLSVHTLRGHARAIRHLCHWLCKKKIALVDLAAELPIPQEPKIARKGIEETHRRMMIEHAARPLSALPLSQVLAMGGVGGGSGEGFTPRVRPEGQGVGCDRVVRAFRDLAILLVASSTGCRLGGLAHLTLGDLSIESSSPSASRRIFVLEKGSKTRPVYLNDEALESLRAWLHVRPHTEDAHVFIGCANGQIAWSALHERGIYEVFRKHAEESGVKGIPGALWSPHQWRHRFGRYMLQQGLDLARLSQIMGHSTVGITVKHYGQFADEQLHDGYDQFMPAADSGLDISVIASRSLAKQS